nr:protein EARLY FLOWERING 3 isoform X1 [Ipomoea trifida]
MKRGKGEEKIMGPMFPRLHVNDTEKGGPRAPPRNKMALYEQLSIPSQRFDNGVLPPNPNSASNLIPPSPGQGNGHERRMFLPMHLPPSTYSAEKLHSSDSNTLTQFESRKKTDEDDFRVPVFVNSNISQGIGKFYKNSEREKVSPSSAAFLGRSTKDAKHTRGGNLRHQESSRQLPTTREQSVKASLSSPSTDKKEHSIKHTDMDFPLHSKQRDGPANNSDLLHKSGINLQPESIVDSKVGDANDDAVVSGPIKGVEIGDSSAPINCFQTEEQIINVVNDVESQENQTFRSLQTQNVDRGDNSSETSMVECISGMDISPDDVVGIIGQKHFWKARRAIVNQQRVFAVQVFELHRLIKVQKLIAESPNLLLEDTAYLGKPLKVSSAKRLPQFEYIKAPQNVPKHKNDSEKPHLRMECSAENTVGKASLSSVQNATQAPSCKPSPGNPPLAAVSNDSNMGPWCFHQPSGQQWLIPVMTPSEGLVYKPYPGPGFTSPGCGGCGPPPPASTPVMGNFFAPAYGVPTSQYHYQGMGDPFAPPVGHGYFPPYGMPVMNSAVSTSAVEQMNPFTRMGSQAQVSGGGVNLNAQHQNSCNMPSQKNGDADVSNADRMHACKDNEIQASCASSPSVRAPGVTVSGPMEGRSVLPLFPTSPVVNVDASHPPHTAHPARVIRVVPHNARSASESAARIFQSIQKERKQYD